MWTIRHCRIIRIMHFMKNISRMVEHLFSHSRSKADRKKLTSSSTTWRSFRCLQMLRMLRALLSIRQQQHILVVLKQPRILKNRIIGVDGWNRVDVQKQVMRRESTLNSNVAKSVRWIDAIHIVHSLSLSCYIWDVWGERVTNVEWIHDVGSFLLKNESSHISQLVFFNEENSTDGSSPSLHQNGKNLSSVITKMKRNG